jgi:hypothetical protein
MRNSHYLPQAMYRLAAWGIHTAPSATGDIDHIDAQPYLMIAYV